MDGWEKPVWVIVVRLTGHIRLGHDVSLTPKRILAALRERRALTLAMPDERRYVRDGAEVVVRRVKGTNVRGVKGKHTRRWELRTAVIETDKNKGPRRNPAQPRTDIASDRPAQNLTAPGARRLAAQTAGCPQSSTRLLLALGLASALYLARQARRLPEAA